MRKQTYELINDQLLVSFSIWIWVGILVFVCLLTSMKTRLSKYRPNSESFLPLELLNEAGFWNSFSWYCTQLENS